MKLEIHIKEEIHIVDGVAQAIEKLHKIVQEWLDKGNDKEPLVIRIKKNEDRGPPALSIHVKDDLPVKSLLK